MKTAFGTRTHFILAPLALIFLCAMGALAQAQTSSGAFTASPSPGFSATPAPSRTAAPQEYRIGPFDKLDIHVFQVEELTLDDVQVDASGQLQLPLIGLVRAQDKTSRELSQEIATKLDAKYLQNAQVSVLVAEAAGQKVTVEGAVTEAGVFQLKGRTTLLQAIAMAKGPTKTADLKKVAIFRDMDGRRMAARYDLRPIRKGEAPDPEILGNDIVVVGDSAAKSFWRELVGTVPVLGVFAYF